jgi:hypothetical protein
MKIGVLLVLVLLMIPLVYSQENDSTVSSGGFSIKDSTNTVLGKQIEISPQLAPYIRGLFGLSNDDNLDFSFAIVLFALWILSFLIIQTVAGSIDFLEGFKSWAVSAIVVCIASISGSIKGAAFFFFSIGDILNFLEGWSLGKLVLSLILLGIIFGALMVFLKYLKEQSILQNAEQKGSEAGTQLKILKRSVPKP